SRRPGNVSMDDDPDRINVERLYIMTHRHSLARAFLYGLLLLLTACAGADKREQYIVPGTTQMRVESLEIRGVERFPLSEITSGLVTERDPGWRASAPWSWLPIVGKERRLFNLFDWRQIGRASCRERVEV